MLYAEVLIYENERVGVLAFPDWTDLVSSEDWNRIREVGRDLCRADAIQGKVKVWLRKTIEERHVEITGKEPWIRTTKHTVPLCETEIVLDIYDTRQIVDAPLPLDAGVYIGKAIQSAPTIDEVRLAIKRWLPTIKADAERRHSLAVASLGREDPAPPGESPGYKDTV